MEFFELCKSNNLDKIKEMYHSINKDNAFIISCQIGQLSVARLLYSLGGVDIHFSYDYAFRISCQYGHLNIAQWLYSLGGVNIHSGGEYAFGTSCSNGHLNVAKWLYSLGDINIHADNEYAFKFSCDHNHIEIVKWLLLIDKFNDEIVDKYLLVQLYEFAFNHGYLPINNMVNTYVEYKNKIKNEIKEKNENGIIGVFELGYLVDIIMIYI